jgi:hypothetical protein
MHGPTSHILQTTFHCNFMMKRNHNIQIDCELTRTLYLSYEASVCLQLWKGQYSLADAMVGLTVKSKPKNFPCNLPWTAVLSLFCPLVKRLEYLKGVTKMWTLPAENQMILLVPAVLWHQRMWKYFKCYKQEWFYNVELLFEKMGYNLHTVCMKIARKY